ncbi:NAD(P)/FAD-dependent oxidoreductase [Halieaceae bacterium IMCC8485]|uniref:NAD(P)/FAD-dependent oxidoreductase n=1 Tax=Candidatus Seongchinamella marina TaxID=2518990 RepID=A0ABT3SYA6_9GAMM|nr:NAD(P)/FAD-dependent oxidoreductase [Candidatus Seongchinamella marina]MCX2974996.1 NAD(P)/FAD-dependent oxidoreductase [Candidatus Seongchinamella marina]
MSNQIEKVDVLIIGAGLAGIGGACQLRRQCPNHSFMILESRETSGGTWDLFRYPGFRSDSDMYTYSYGFKPWKDKSTIAEGHKILSYIREAAAEYDVERHIRYQHKVIGANWSTREKRWLVTAERSDTGEHVTVSCMFMFNCCGYYDYEQGYTPEFTGSDEFTGQLFHAQHWPEDLDYRGKRVVVIGSGATAVTLVPAMAGETSSLVMLQRTPTYIANVPGEDPMGLKLRKWLPNSWIFRLIRWKKVMFQIYVYRLSRKKPKALKKFLLGQVKQALGPDYDVATHFTPPYNPWDQRLCAVPDGDMFEVIRKGRAEVVTDHVDSFNAEGIQLKSGRQLDADIVVLATGLNLKFAGGIVHSIDDKEIDITEHFIYRGMMFSDLPNLAFTVGYTNSSWTLKTDLTSNYVCRLLKKMERGNYATVTPSLNGDVEEVPLLDFDAGYVMRARDQMPKNGDRLPWKNYQNYIRDFMGLRIAGLNDTELEFR